MKIYDESGLAIGAAAPLAPAETLAAACETLVDAIMFDESGEAGRGGNGGLISRETLRKAGHVRLAVSNYRRAQRQEEE